MKSKAVEMYLFCACAVEDLPFVHGCFSFNFTSSEMKRRRDAAAAVLQETKRGRCDSGLGAEPELSSPGSFHFHGQYLKLLSMLSVVFPLIRICYIMFFDFFAYFGDSLNFCW